MTDTILETDDLTKTFGALRANDGISLSVSAGTIHGIIGPNGSGKTTFFNTLTGFYEADGGRVVFDGTDITNWEPHQIAQRGLGRTFQIPAPFEDMTVRDNLLAVNTGETMDIKRERAAETLSLLDIDHLSDDDAHDMSGGQHKLLELARVLMLEPDCILLDEPTAGVNPVLADRIIDHIKSLNEDGRSFLVIEHDMPVMAELADVITVFDQGKVVTEGTFDEVTSNERVMEAYLGSESVDGSVFDHVDSTPDSGNTTVTSETRDSNTQSTEAVDADNQPDLTRRLVGTDIVSGYGQHQVLDEVSIESRDGVTGIFGPNGSGKSTLLKALNGLLPVWSGSITYEGEEITNVSPEALVEKGITTLQQDSGVFQTLTIEENLRVGGYLVDDDVADERLESVYNTFPILLEKRNEKANVLSGGQRMMLSFGRAMMTGADTYLLDEPSAGLAPTLVEDVFDMVEQLDRAGSEVLLVEQNVREALRIVDYVYLLSQGRVQFEGTPDELRQEEELLDVYLGIE